MEHVLGPAQAPVEGLAVLALLKATAGATALHVQQRAAVVDIVLAPVGVVLLRLTVPIHASHAYRRPAV
jgi:hypothetical protein